jgi:hypothetical protein
MGAQELAEKPARNFTEGEGQKYQVVALLDGREVVVKCPITSDELESIIGLMMGSIDQKP